MAVVGGGLVGLALAYELACLGASVTVVDAAHPGRATDAGAGILSPATSVDDDPELWPYLRACTPQVARLVARLADDGADVSAAAHATCGALSLCRRASEEEWFAPFAAMALRRAPDDLAEITPDEARARVPVLGPVHRALFAPGAARVDGRGLAAALRHAATARGVRFVGAAAGGLRTGPGVVRAVRVEGGPDIPCATLAVAGGAWTPALASWLEQPLPVGPTKGQIAHMALDGETATWPIVQPLLTHYLVPWPGGRIACGGTFEPRAGYSVDVTVGGLHELLRECLSVAPGLATARYLETRVGLRPTTADDRALVGPVPGWANAWVVTGHGAHGLLQGPLSARLAAHAIAGTPGPADAPPLPAHFDPARFV